MSDGGSSAERSRSFFSMTPMGFAIANLLTGKPIAN
jgi:hypothetical protein